MKVFKRKNYRYLLSLSHFCTDINSGSLASILPFLIAAYNYDYTTASILVMASNLVGSIVQPLFGDLADKRNIPATMGLGVIMAGGGMALTGIVTSYFALCTCVIIAGIGSAMFHPQAIRIMNKISEEGKTASAISIFSFGGTMGFAVGPLLVTAAITSLGLKGTGVLCIPAILVSGILFSQSRNFTNSGIRKIRNQGKEDQEDPMIDESGEEALSKGAELSDRKSAGFEAFDDDNPNKLPDQWKPFAVLGIFVFTRSVVLTGANTFLSLYFIDVLGQSATVGNIMLSAYSVVATLTTLYGGVVADKIGYTKTIKLALVILTASAICFSFSRILVLSVLLIIPMATGANLSYSPIIVLGQEYLPNHTGLASGLTTGLAISLGGLVSPLFGLIGDSYGLEVVMYVIAFFSIIPCVLSLLLPEPVTQNKH